MKNTQIVTKENVNTNDTYYIKDVEGFVNYNVQEFGSYNQCLIKHNPQLLTGFKFNNVDEYDYGCYVYAYDEELDEETDFIIDDGEYKFLDLVSNK